MLNNNIRAEKTAQINADVIWRSQSSLSHGQLQAISVAYA